jgi:hypothetical protein
MSVQIQVDGADHINDDDDHTAVVTINVMQINLILRVLYVVFSIHSNVILC